MLCEFAERIACAACAEAESEDPAEIASHLGVELYAVDPMRLIFRHGEYFRVEDQPIILVDATLGPPARLIVIAHELAHHIVFAWRLNTPNEEAFCNAFADVLSARRFDRRAAACLEDSERFVLDEFGESDRPLDDALVSAVVAAQ